MSIAILLAFLIGGWFFSFLRRPKFSKLLNSVAIVCALGVGCGYVPRLLLGRLQVATPLRSPEWKKNNLIIVLGAGTARWPQTELVSTYTLGYSRNFEAARLYFACRRLPVECHILATGGDPLQHGISEAEVIARELTEIGVDPANLLVETKSRNTFENARFSSELVEASGYDQIVLVTSGIHLRRSAMLFQHFFGAVVGAPADYFGAVIAPLPVAFNFLMTDVALHEYLGMLQFFIYNALGWNPPAKVV